MSIVFKYVLEQGIEQFKEFRQLILVGAQPPVAYFAYPGKSSEFTSPVCQIHTLAKPGEDLSAHSMRLRKPCPYAAKSSQRKRRSVPRCLAEKSHYRDSPQRLERS